jgi:hypothetical protein
MLPANRRVAPNSPKARAQASEAPTRRPGSAIGNATRKKGNRGRGPEGSRHDQHVWPDLAKGASASLNEERGGYHNLREYDGNLREGQSNADRPESGTKKALASKRLQQGYADDGGWYDDGKAHQNFDHTRCF